MTRSFRFVLAVALAVTGVTLGACAKSPASDDPHPGVTAPAPTVEPAAPIALTVGVPASAESLPVLIADEDDALVAGGIPTADVRVFDDIAAVRAAFEAGEVDAAIVGLVDAVELEAGSRPVTTVTVASDPAASKMPSVLVVADDYLLSIGGSESIDVLTDAWDAAVTWIEGDRKAAAKRLSDLVPVAKLLSAYAAHKVPAEAMVAAAIEQAGTGDAVTYEHLLLVLPR